ncbi:hypothetical protein RJ639_032561 [Escallonia herrerae]|uniref:CCHC-type domain-containing protein n=1 Tax=Escallonia herrerae TaxID=1293975 RepID=A0AA88WZ60_9ASTE|nr:hypothetical protein RJ639_032561 [Escallonia herrerae]
MEEVRAVINSQELRKKNSENRGEELGDGLMARGRSTDHAGSKNKGRLRSQSKCYHCHKEGHYRNDCPQRKGKKEDNSKTTDVAGVVEDNFDGLSKEFWAEAVNTAAYLVKNFSIGCKTPEEV